MAQLIYAPRAFADLTRLTDFLLESAPDAALDAADLIAEAVEVLERHPEMGRPVEEGLRELVISRGRSGYLALYSYLEQADLVVILSIRHQREAGYPEG